MTFKYTIDADLPLPLGTQLRGLIEYGISCGELDVGSRLPPVRQLAKEIGISPMTVSQVYKQLQENGLLEGKAGQGTFVHTNAHILLSPKKHLEGLHIKIDELVEEAANQGVSRADLTRLFSARINFSSNSVPAIRITFVGHFKEANREYLANMRAQFSKRDTVTSTTFYELEANEAMCRQVGKSDLVLTFANRIVDVARLVKTDSPIMAVSFIPSSKTLGALATLDPMKSVGIISTFEEFLPIMKAGIHRHAPQIADVRATILGHDDMHAIIRNSDILIYASGVEETLPDLPKLSHSFEYRHILHPHEIKENILPVIEELRVAVTT